MIKKGDKMRFELNPPKDEKNPEPIVRLGLRHSSSGVCIVATTEDGRTHHLLTLLSDGRFHRCLHIDEDSGFKIGKSGQLVERRYL